VGSIFQIILQRLALGLVTLLVVSMVIFVAVNALPGDFAQAILGQGATDEAVTQIRADLGLDQNYFLRYFGWLGNVLTGNLGISFAQMNFASTLGILAALYRNSLFDRAVNIATLSSISSPEFFLAYILILVLAVLNPVFPSLSNVYDGMPLGEKLNRTMLPALTLTLVVTAHMMRMTRAAIINLLASPYIEMASLKGISPMRVIVRHALPNALAPIINVIALNLAYLITGVVVVEVVFVYPGIGQLFVDSVKIRDIPVVQACCLIFAAAYILLNLMADILSILSNPRLRHPK
jgi:peptide/nickel transport system permease protein